MTARVDMWTSVIRRGGEIGFAKGDSDARREARATIIVVGRVGVHRIAFSMSEAFVGVPWTIVRCGEGDSEDVLRTSAIPVWPCERASSRISLPVRPEAPRIRICILDVEVGGIVLESNSLFGSIKDFEVYNAGRLWFLTIDW
jgi:hypothetical protein